MKELNGGLPARLRAVGFLLFAAAVSMTTLSLAPMGAATAGVRDRSVPPAVVEADSADCSNIEQFVPGERTIPSISITTCEACRLDDTERYALQRSYGEAALRAGYIVDPLVTYSLHITEIGLLPNGKPFLRGVIDDRQLTVGDPHPGETLATVAGRLALIAVSLNR